MVLASGGSRLQRMAARIALVAVALGVVLLIAAPARPAPADQEPQGLKFDVRCQRTGSSLDHGGLGAISCALVVTGLPAPLGDEVTVTLFRADDRADSPSGSAPTDTVIADEAHSAAPGQPVLVSRYLPFVSPIPPPTFLRVADPPPKSL